MAETFVVGQEVHVEGNIRTSGPVNVQGIVDGEIEGTTVVVAEGAEVSGAIVGDYVVVHGVVTGDVFASRLDLMPTSTVHGRIFHAELNISEGAYFEGKSRREPHPQRLRGAD